MGKPIIFISHISEEAKLAAILKAHVEADFIDTVSVYVSSDTESISAGENLLTSINVALSDACIELILCSKASIKRPWVNFEAGAGWMRHIPVVPVCHTKLLPKDLPMPFSVLQAVEANQERGLQRIYRSIAEKLESRVPPVDLSKMIKEIEVFEAEYAGSLAELSKDEVLRERAAGTRVRQYLEARKPDWRKIQRIAIRNGVSEGEAMELLRSYPDVEFEKDKGENIIARIKPAAVFD